MDKLCRICLTEPDTAFNIFDSKGNTFEVVNILRKHFWFDIQPTDPISTIICMDCWNKINDFHIFYLHVKEVQNSFAEFNSNVNLTEVTVIEPNFANQESSTASHSMEPSEDPMCIKEEYIDDKIWQEGTELSSDKPEINPLDILELNADVSEYKNQEIKEGEVKDGISLKNDELERGTSSENNQSSQFSVLSPSIQKSPSKPRRRKNKAEIIAFTEAAEHRTKKLKFQKDVKFEQQIKGIKNLAKARQKRHKVISENDDVLIKKYISMGCELCPFVGINFLELADHFKTEHNSLKPYVICCGRKLNKRFLIVQHAYKHEDPEFYKCKECNKIFSDGYVLRSHMLANHSSEEDLTFNCDQCTKKFSRRYLLELHKPSHIPPEKRSFWCNKCPQPKVFASDHLLQIHTNMRHTKAPNICHVCGKEIRDNQAYDKHVRLHFEDSGPRVKCPHPNCDRWLKDKDNLKQHLRRHRDEGKTFVCNECGKACKNRRSLTSHINYTHTDERYPCEECNKTFKRAISLREHMAQHTGETLYKCPFCTRTFNSNANMHSHKKKMHPLEWDNWRKTKRGSSQQVVALSREMAPEKNTDFLGKMQ